MKIYIVQNIYNTEINAVFSTRDFAEAWIEGTFDPHSFYVDEYEVWQ